MTRREQTLRAWITRKSPRHHWKSCVSFRGKTHILVTTTRSRRAAAEFNLLHLSRIIARHPAPVTSSSHQPQLF